MARPKGRAKIRRNKMKQLTMDKGVEILQKINWKAFCKKVILASAGTQIAVTTGGKIRTFGSNTQLFDEFLFVAESMGFENADWLEYVSDFYTLDEDGDVCITPGGKKVDSYVAAQHSIRMGWVDLGAVEMSERAHAEWVGRFPVYVDRINGVAAAQ
jgi:hypothetical protein